MAMWNYIAILGIFAVAAAVTNAVVRWRGAPLVFRSMLKSIGGAAIGGALAALGISFYFMGGAASASLFTALQGAAQALAIQAGAAAAMPEDPANGTSF